MFVTPKQMQQLEALTDQSGVSYGEMMERAGTALAESIRSRWPEKRRVLFLTGSGNNGGDCYVAARVLREAGWEPEILAPLGSPRTDISIAAKERAVQAGVPICEGNPLPDAPEIVVDGLFGTGFRGELSDEIRSLLAQIRAEIFVACDVPSGGNALTGTVSEGTLHADLTVTFGAIKLGMTQYPLRSYCGEIVTGSIGTPDEAYAQLQPSAAEALDLNYLATHRLPPYRKDAYKQANGTVMAVVGASRMRGAAVLAVHAAMRSGAGMVTCASAEPVLDAIMQRTPEALCLPLAADTQGYVLCDANRKALTEALHGKSALLLGCGLGHTAETVQLTGCLLRESTCPVILDADGLNAAASCIEWIPGGRSILTPHPGEAARLLGTDTATVQADRLNAAMTLAARTGAVVVLKGAGTIVTDGTRTAVCTLGNPGMAKAGSGDVLAGITAALAANQPQRSLFETACLAVTIHAAAGDAAAVSERYLLPQDIITALQGIL